LLFLIASLAFFTSGFAALEYQILWQRLLVLPIGADVHSTTVIVAAYMAGLGCGSLAGGYLADRLTPARSLVMFVVAELAVGAFGLISRTVFYDWLYLRFGAVQMAPPATATVVFVSLLWPTFWMGMSLPLLGRAVSEQLGAAARRVGVLYGLNTLGAAAGAFATTWALLPRLGLAGGLKVAASLNVLAAVAVSLIVVTARARRPDASEAADDPRVGSATSASSEAGWSFRTWAVLYGFAGFQALSLEIVWFRLLGVMLKSSAFTFGTLLTIYLAGLGLGASLASALLRRIRRPALAFLLLQACVGLYAGVSIYVLSSLLGSSGALPSLRTYFAGYEPLDAASAFSTLWQSAANTEIRWHFVRLYLLLPALLVGPPTLAMGASFPLLQKVVLVDPDRIGRRIGLVLIANIAGGVAGSILTGWVALSWIDSAALLRALTASSAVFLGLAVRIGMRQTPRPIRWVTAAAAVSLVALAATLVPDGRTLWARLHGSSAGFIVFGEDGSGLSLLKEEPTVFQNRAVVFVNGTGQSRIPYGNIHSVLGALPAFIHSDPREAAVIGLGSGDTLYALAGRLELSRITCIEIIKPQLATLGEWSARTGYPPLGTILEDRRFEHVYGDGRIHVMRSDRRFDIIEADALQPTSAYAGNLYSAGYFELLRSRLAPRGLAVSWSPTPRVHATFVHVFPHVLSFGDIVVGSSDPIRFDAAEIRARSLHPAVQEHYDRAGIDIEALLAPYLSSAPRAIHSSGEPPADGDMNEDLFPRDEFSVPRSNSSR